MNIHDHLAQQQRRSADIRKRITDAGYAYPINWDEMGSSEKDLWEERMLRSIERFARLSKGKH